MNLFENFDSSTNNFLSLNWIMMIFPMIFLPYYYWLIPSRIYLIWLMLIKFIYLEFKNISTLKYESNIIIFLTLMIYIMLLNLFSLIPYIFTITSHMSFNLILSMSMWLSFMIYSWIKMPMKNLTHLVPLNTPKMLMHFMVIIELISNLIRPWTLAIRLTANLISGHLLFTLIGLLMSNIIIPIIMIMIMIQNMLLILEFSMSIIQAYVFSILSILYFSESKC
uniref:ATP synthase F0 subunit 6 n=1 Tax=Ceratina smaragdula TaxID=710033 RepID=UPI002079FC0D|nr:ATP synthase F0 subunit 6 [Ceratina smaragdula]URX52620.1 ATP synthase F0 subunit 6 [Ceratina smaragdula]